MAWVGPEPFVAVQEASREEGAGSIRGAVWQRLGEELAVLLEPKEVFTVTVPCSVPGSVPGAYLHVSMEPS